MPIISNNLFGFKLRRTNGPYPFLTFRLHLQKVFSYHILNSEFLEVIFSEMCKMVIQANPNIFRDFGVFFLTIWNNIGNGQIHAIIQTKLKL